MARAEQVFLVGCVMDDIHRVPYDADELLSEELLTLTVDGMIGLGEPDSVLLACLELAKSTEAKSSIEVIVAVSVRPNEYIGDLFD